MVHILKRLLIIVAGYFVAVIIGLVSVVIIYVILSSLPGAPSYFSALTMSPLLILVWPQFGLFVLYLALMLTCLPALAAALLAEIFSLRQAWLHALVGAAIAAGDFLHASPKIIGALGGTDWADLGIIAAAGAVAGLTYWLIAGRK